MNFVLPVGQIAAALALLMQPHAARVFHQKGYAAVHDLTRSLVWMYPAGATVYWIVIMVLAHRIVPLLYGGNYPGVVSLIPWLALGSVLQTATYASAVGLRAMHAPFSVFQAYGIASVVVFLVGVPAAIMFGVPGAVAGFVIGNGTAMALAYRLVLRHTSETLGQLARQEG
jgi:O-antigen/teichoic acid export membrane protein